MSYVRWSSVGHPWQYDSDLYIYDSISGGTECCGCWLMTGDEDCWLGDLDGDETHPETVAHVREHIAAGHRVPEFVIPRLSDPDNAMTRARLRRRLVLVVFACIVVGFPAAAALTFTPLVAGPAHWCHGYRVHPAGQRGALTTWSDRCHLDKP